MVGALATGTATAVPRGAAARVVVVALRVVALLVVVVVAGSATSGATASESGKPAGHGVDDAAPDRDGQYHQVADAGDAHQRPGAAQPAHATAGRVDEHGLHGDAGQALGRRLLSEVGHCEIGHRGVGHGGFGHGGAGGQGQAHRGFLVCGAGGVRRR